MRESGEDYLEAVLEMEQEKGVVRLTDVAAKLSVTKPSANRAMKILQVNGYIHQESYGTIELTPKGRIKASQVYNRHKVLTTFLGSILGLEPEIAEADACRMEHVLSAETMERLAAFIDDHQHVEERTKTE
jgi:DtxR family transcriptional regulator, Mn-dependent transcriptional regulator